MIPSYLVPSLLMPLSSPFLASVAPHSLEPFFLCLVPLNLTEKEMLHRPPWRRPALPHTSLLQSRSLFSPTPYSSTLLLYTQDYTSVLYLFPYLLLLRTLFRPRLGSSSCLPLLSLVSPTLLVTSWLVRIPSLYLVYPSSRILSSYSLIALLLWSPSALAASPSSSLLLSPVYCTLPATLLFPITCRSTIRSAS